MCLTFCISPLRADCSSSSLPFRNTSSIDLHSMAFLLTWRSYLQLGIYTYVKSKSSRFLIHKKQTCVYRFQCLKQHERGVLFKVQPSHIIKTHGGFISSTIQHWEKSKANFRNSKATIFESRVFSFPLCQLDHVAPSSCISHGEGLKWICITP